MTAARRFFVEGAKAPGDVVELGGSDAHKIAHVLRLAAGDTIELIDSSARTFSAALLDVGRVVRASVLAEQAPPAAPPALTVDVAQAVPKGSRMDLVVEKGTELGVAAFLPFFCERSIGRGAGAERLSRWRRIARGAAQQSRRTSVPDVHEPVAFEHLVASFSDYDAVLFAWELAEPAPLARRLQEAVPAAGRVLLVVGPEGGFTHGEADLAMRSGAVTLSLGSRILRTDTAALVLLAVIGALAS